ncbi:flagellar motor switch protein [Marinovum sp.]|uniref:flagellar motor switch protein n=1 Tax=Marinovum sp. TaxID=2024839 RepID=UPI002B279A0F|nr:flagellar motor switch protein [Marinovum sp.]
MSFAIDIALVVLLLGTLGYAWLVDRRVRRMMEALREMEPLIGSFSQAVDRSESTVSALRAAREVAPLRKRADTRTEARPESEAPSSEPAFRTKREPAPRNPEATPIAGKSELIRGFFDTVRQREA